MHLFHLYVHYKEWAGVLKKMICMVFTKWDDSSEDGKGARAGPLCVRPCLKTNDRSHLPCTLSPARHFFPSGRLPTLFPCGF